MNRPKNIILVASSLDGRISLMPNRTMFEEMNDKRTFHNDLWEVIETEIMSKNNSTANMLGSNSLVKEGENLKEIPKFTGDKSELFQDYLPDEVIKNPKRKGFLVVVDGRGRLRSGYKGREEEPMLHLVSHGVSSEYLYFLKNHNIPYIITGDTLVNLKEAMVKLKDKLGIDALLHSSGGKLAGAMLREHLIDEVNVIVQPQLIGGKNTPSLFECCDLKLDEFPTNLKLLKNETLRNQSIWLQYEVLK